MQNKAKFGQKGLDLGKIKILLSKTFHFLRLWCQLYEIFRFIWFYDHTLNKIT